MNFQIPVITNRGVELATLFMQGVECALFVNDSCGAPLPWLMCCPWLFFDGKLFHQKLLKAAGAKNLVDICDGQIDQVSTVERMRAAILEGLQPQFAYPPFPPVNPPFGGYYESPLLPTPISNRGRGRGIRYGPGVWRKGSNVEFVDGDGQFRGSRFLLVWRKGSNADFVDSDKEFRGSSFYGDEGVEVAVSVSVEKGSNVDLVDGDEGFGVAVSVSVKNL
ncbi:constitutive coactivator of PPAR-gamma-like protein 1 [Tachypleus tridentatus]|uniref:constitutive coactivator of PPAR-gamma-like protein 1 n=1 Tax=Tachypleus tridentatus TaxID=6853 RepID=UPI003FD4D35C